MSQKVVRIKKNIADSNFSFLEKISPTIAKDMSNAEHLIYFDYEITLILLRKACEGITNFICEKYNNEPSNSNNPCSSDSADICTKINFLVEKAFIPSAWTKKLHELRIKGNGAIHKGTVGSGDAHTNLRYAFDIAKSFYEKFYDDTNKDKINLKNITFNKPKEIKKTAESPQIKTALEEIKKEITTIRDEINNKVREKETNSKRELSEKEIQEIIDQKISSENNYFEKLEKQIDNQSEKLNTIIKELISSNVVKKRYIYASLISVIILFSAILLFQISDIKSYLLKRSYDKNHQKLENSFYNKDYKTIINLLESIADKPHLKDLYNYYYGHYLVNEGSHINPEIYLEKVSKDNSYLYLRSKTLIIQYYVAKYGNTSKEFLNKALSIAKEIKEAGDSNDYMYYFLLYIYGRQYYKYNEVKQIYDDIKARYSFYYDFEKEKFKENLSFKIVPYHLEALVFVDLRYLLLLYYISMVTKADSECLEIEKVQAQKKLNLLLKNTTTIEDATKCLEDRLYTTHLIREHYDIMNKAIQTDNCYQMR